MRIIVDQDEVLARWVDKVLEWYNKDYGTSFSRKDVSDYWAMEKLLGPQGRDFLRSCMRYPDLYQELEPMDGAIEGMRSLIEAGHDVVIATAVPKCAFISLHGKAVWLRRHMPFFDMNNLVAIQRKELLSGDLLLDDGPHNIARWASTGRPSVVFDAPWNQECKEAVARVHGWPEFLVYVQAHLP